MEWTPVSPRNSNRALIMRILCPCVDGDEQFRWQNKKGRALTGWISRRAANLAAWYKYAVAAKVQRSAGIGMAGGWK